MLTKFVTFIAALAVTVAVSLSLPGPAEAQHGYKVAGVRHHALGGCVRNTHTHVMACISGYHRFKAKAHGRTKTFYEVRYSAQRCSHGECHGRVHTGIIKHPYKLGSKGRTAAAAQRGGEGCGIYYALCWAADQVNKGEKAVIDHVIKPCAFGSAKGFGGVMATNITVQTLFRGGLITASQFGKYFTGPAGIGIISVATCSIGFAEGGINDVQGLFD